VAARTRRCLEHFCCGVRPGTRHTRSPLARTHARCAVCCRAVARLEELCFRVLLSFVRSSGGRSHLGVTDILDGGKCMQPAPCSLCALVQPAPVARPCSDAWCISESICPTNTNTKWHERHGRRAGGAHRVFIYPRLALPATKMGKGMGGKGSKTEKVDDVRPTLATCAAHCRALWLSSACSSRRGGESKTNSDLINREIQACPYLLRRGVRRPAWCRSTAAHVAALLSRRDMVFGRAHHSALSHARKNGCVQVS